MQEYLLNASYEYAFIHFRCADKWLGYAAF